MSVGLLLIGCILFNVASEEHADTDATSGSTQPIPPDETAEVDTLGSPPRSVFGRNLDQFIESFRGIELDRSGQHRFGSRADMASRRQSLIRRLRSWNN